MSKGGTQKTTRSSHTETSVNQNESSYKQNFTKPESQQNFNDFLGASKSNYGNMTDLTNNAYKSYMSGKSLGDDSYFKQGWGLANGIDQSNIQNMNSRSLNPYDDEVTNNYIKASNQAAILANGQAKDQMSQNMIGTGMPNGSGHQTAAAKVGAQLAANINAQNQQTYLARQNALEQGALQANGQLENFYNSLSAIGLDYTKLTQQDLSTLLSAYNQQNDALKTWGTAVEMGSDPTITTTGQQTGVSDSKSKQKTENSGGWGNALGTALGFLMPTNFFGGGNKGGTT